MELQLPRQGGGFVQNWNRAFLDCFARETKGKKKQSETTGKQRASVDAGDSTAKLHEWKKQSAAEGGRLGKSVVGLDGVLLWQVLSPCRRTTASSSHRRDWARSYICFGQWAMLAGC